jgi:hypothetical protein
MLQIFLSENEEENAISRTGRKCEDNIKTNLRKYDES